MTYRPQKVEADLASPFVAMHESKDEQRGHVTATSLENGCRRGAEQGSPKRGFACCWRLNVKRNLDSRF